MTVATHAGRSGVDLVPIGSIVAWSLEIPPDNWLLCDGSLVQRDAYPELYRVLTGDGAVFPYGANQNSASGELFFRLPDMRERLPRSPSKTSPPPGTVANVGATGGSNNNTHNHTFTNTIAANSLTGGAHLHFTTSANTSEVPINGWGGTGGVGVGSGTGGTGGTGTAKTLTFNSHGHGDVGLGWGGHGNHAHGANFSDAVSTDGAHNHAVTVTNSNHSPTAVDHRPPYMEANYIIFAGANRYYDWWVLGSSPFPTTVAS